ncbi:hypothetical protein RRG08_005633 [Elysia crispata]|uniref:Uncharacterized protein n=1 Tax=Elysia crispata TaxID=231223 RepID=A0AAE0YXC7_9GAST|nr:hypothetical protein RRG08_005633 [Elysia crispata]
MGRANFKGCESQVVSKPAASFTSRDGLLKVTRLNLRGHKSPAMVLSSHLFGGLFSPFSISLIRERWLHPRWFTGASGRSLRHSLSPALSGQAAPLTTHYRHQGDSSPLDTAGQRPL